MITYKIIKSFLVILFTVTLLNACSSINIPKIPKNPKGKIIEPNARIRAQQNVIDGKGMKLFKSKKGDGTFSFASSNPMWKAALDTISFVSLASADYSGGVLITDWYSEGNPDEAIKITIRFLSNKIRADGLVVSLYKRSCVNNVCSTKEIKSDLNFEIKDKILRTAAIYKIQDDKNFKSNRPKRKIIDKDSK